MSDAEEPRSVEPAQPSPAEAVVDRERVRLFESGPQPLRATTPLRTVGRPAQPIARPETGQPPRRFGRTLHALKTMLPLAQKALPLLEGNVAAALANLLIPGPVQRHVNLEPVERALTVVHAEHQELRGQLGAQGTALKRIGDQLADVKEATERHASVQREVTEDLEGLRRRVGRIAWIGFALLAVSIGLNVALFLRVGGFLR
ncbi:MAG TPA: hypothetical protein VE291_09335 [Terracidiphilus sp.]|jgi:hypothetical protein|nr:hypothetical protein [Terracidiphilus sp.]